MDSVAKENEYDEYLAELREQVCSHCIERHPQGPPCSVHGKPCGIELHIPKLVAMCRDNQSVRMDPYIEGLHETICQECAYRTADSCPCPLRYLLLLAVEAVETVERRREARQPSTTK